MQFSARSSELYMEFAAPESTAAGNEYTLYGWPVRRAETAGARYHTLIAGDITTLPADARLRLTKALSALFSEYLAGTKRVLVCGLGNRELAADRLGYGVCSRLSLCGPLPDGRALYSFVPGTRAATGIPTDRLIRMTASCLSADRIIAVDALCARSAGRLTTVAQLSDTGITPGSGTCESDAQPSCAPGARQNCTGDEHAENQYIRDKYTHDEYPPEISTATMPCPVVTAGVPTVIRTTLPDGGSTPYLVCTGNIDRTVDCWSAVLSSAILRAMLSR